MNEAEQAAAALKIQTIRRGSKARLAYRDVRDEEARRQWIEYYVQTGNLAEARELGWDDGEDPAPVARAESDVTTGPIAGPIGDAEREKAARLLQAHARGSSARLAYRDKRDDEARSQWITYYLALGDLESARELGWDEADEEQAKAATALAAARRGQLARRQPARRSLAAGVAMPSGMPFPELPKPSNADNEDGEDEAPPTPGRDAKPSAAEREAFVKAEREAYGGKTENEMALDAAQQGAPIFSARWFGKVWDGMLSPQNHSPAAKEPAPADAAAAEAAEEARRAKQREEKAAILVQCWCRVVLAKVAVKNESRKYRLLALYAHVEEKNAGKIQAAFRNRRPSQMQPSAGQIESSAGEIETSRGEIATSAGEIAGSGTYSANYELETKASPTRAAAAAGPPPAEKPLKRLSGLLGRAGGEDLERKIAEIKFNHAATVMQKLHRDASKREVRKRLQGVLWKRSQGLPMFFRRTAYISADGYSLVYRNSKDASTDHLRSSSSDIYAGLKKSEGERRIPLASITAIALESELYLEFSVDSTIRGKKFLFRCETRKDLQMWLNGLADLTP